MKYKLRNWSQYNRSLINRGSITFWFSEEAIEGWLSKRIKGRGHPEVYSEAAILTALILKFVYHLTYRSSQGFLQSIFDLMGVDLPVPYYTQICRRAGKSDILEKRLSKRRPTDVVIDSTGLKIYGEGEWKVKKHGKEKRRTWRKIHLAICADTHEILASELTGGNESDCKTFPKLMEKLPKSTKRVYADGAYDTEGCYKILWEHGVEGIIPPRKGARYQKNAPPWKETRNNGILESLGFGEENGREMWKICKGYHRRSLAETGMYRMKQLLGARLTSRKESNQKVEARVKVEILNRMAKLGMPEAYAV